MNFNQPGMCSSETLLKPSAIPSPNEIPIDLNASLTLPSISDFPSLVFLINTHVDLLIFRKVIYAPVEHTFKHTGVDIHTFNNVTHFVGQRAHIEVSDRLTKLLQPFVVEQNPEGFTDVAETFHRESDEIAGEFDSLTDEMLNFWDVVDEFVAPLMDFGENLGLVGVEPVFNNLQATTRDDEQYPNQVERSAL